MLRGGDLEKLAHNFCRFRGQNVHVVGDTRGSKKLSRALLRLPDTEKLDKEVVGEAAVQHLGDQEDVGRESRLQHDGHVGGVEQADGVRAADTTLASRLDGDLNAETLEVDDSAEDDDSGDQVHDVGQVLAVESLAESDGLVGPGEEQVDKGNDGTLELGTTASVNGGGRESLPHDRLADVGRNEERDTAAKTVALLEQLVEENNDQTGDDKLDNEENADTSTEVRGLAVETGDDVDDSLTEGQEDSQELLGSLVDLAVGLEVEVDVDEVGTSKELEDHAGGDDGGNTQLHQRTSVTGHHHTQPVERVGGIRGDNAVQRHLAHDQEDEERQTSPYQAVVEGHLALGELDLGDERDEGFDEIEEPDCAVLLAVSFPIATRSCAWLCAPSRDLQLRRGHLRPLMIASLEAQEKRKETKGSEEEGVVGDARDG